MEVKQSGAKEAPSKTQSHGCLSLLFHTATPLAIILTLHSVLDKCDEYLYPSVEEQILEERLDRPVDLSIFDVGEDRAKKVEQFDELYRETRRDWDYFDRQFAQISAIEIERLSLLDKARVGAVNSFTNKLYVTHNNYWCLLDPDELVHELAHLWQYQLDEKDKFEQQWYNITGTGYVGCHPNKNPFCRVNDFEPYILAVAAPRDYGAINIDEHIAETTRLVYLLQDPSAHGFSLMEESGEIVEFHVGVMRLPVKILPRIEQQIELLAAYDFFSEQEKTHALQNLERLKNTDL